MNFTSGSGFTIPMPKIFAKQQAAPAPAPKVVPAQKIRHQENNNCSPVYLTKAQASSGINTSCPYCNVQLRLPSMVLDQDIEIICPRCSNGFFRAFRQKK